LRFAPLQTALVAGEIRYKIMKKYLFAFTLIFIFSNARANEEFASDPNIYVISGEDIYGNEGYSITIKYVWKKEARLIHSIKIKAYDSVAEIEGEILSKVENIHLDKIVFTVPIFTLKYHSENG
jgi:hypothetical protein